MGGGGGGGGAGAASGWSVNEEPRARRIFSAISLSSGRSAASSATRVDAGCDTADTSSRRSLDAGDAPVWVSQSIIDHTLPHPAASTGCFAPARSSYAPRTSRSALSQFSASSPAWSPCEIS